MNSIGSIWRKWDLHIHTSASFHWSGKRLQDQTNDEREDTCKTIVEKLNSLDVDAFCIMDYWIFDGYLAVRKYIENNPGVLTKCLFPVSYTHLKHTMAAPSGVAISFGGKH